MVSDNIVRTSQLSSALGILFHRTLDTFHAHLKRIILRHTPQKEEGEGPNGKTTKCKK